MIRVPRVPEPPGFAAVRDKGAQWLRNHPPTQPAVPIDTQARAERTIIELGLRDGEFLLRARRRWLEMYLSARLTLDGLHEIAPLLAAMVEREGLRPRTPSNERLRR
ncbi:MAG: hypothetical protein AAGF11_55740 [Myxococcota bacterium]